MYLLYKSRRESITSPDATCCVCQCDASHVVRQRVPFANRCARKRTPIVIEDLVCPRKRKTAISRTFCLLLSCDALRRLISLEETKNRTENFDKMSVSSHHKCGQSTRVEDVLGGSQKILGTEVVDALEELFCRLRSAIVQEAFPHADGQVFIVVVTDA